MSLQNTAHLVSFHEECSLEIKCRKITTPLLFGQFVSPLASQQSSNAKCKSKFQMRPRKKASKRRSLAYERCSVLTSCCSIFRVGSADVLSRSQPSLSHKTNIICIIGIILNFAVNTSMFHCNVPQKKLFICRK